MTRVAVLMEIVAMDELRPHLGEQAGKSFTDAELHYASGFRDPLPSLAARLCAKRAWQRWASTAGLRVPGLRQVEVVASPFGPPRLVLGGDALAGVPPGVVEGIHVSLSHCWGYAGALVTVTADGDLGRSCDEWS